VSFAVQGLVGKLDVNDSFECDAKLVRKDRGVRLRIVDQLGDLGVFQKRLQGPHVFPELYNVKEETLQTRLISERYLHQTKPPGGCMQIHALAINGYHNVSEVGQTIRCLCKGGLVRYNLDLHNASRWQAVLPLL